MPRIIRGGLIQATLCEPATSPVEKIKRAMIEKHEGLIAQAAGRGAIRTGNGAGDPVGKDVVALSAIDQISILEFHFCSSPNRLKR